MSARRLLLILLALLVAVPAWAATRRQVEIRYDITLEGQEALEIWIDCQHPATSATVTAMESLTRCEKNDAHPAKQLRGPQAFAFVLSDKDQVSFVLLYKKATDVRAEIVYSVTGTGVSDKDIQAFQKIVGGDAKAAAGTGTQAGRSTSPADAAEIVAMTDDTDIGQKVLATFSLKEKKTTGTETTEVTKATRGPFAFRVGGAPRFKMSYGFVFSTAPEPTVAILKTSTVVNFEKDDKPQQSYEQVVALKDADATLQPIQSLVAMANFRLAGAVYGSVGFQVNQKIFEEPLLGLTVRHEVGKMGLNVSAGVHFSHETEIRTDTGFAEGSKLDPTLGITVDEIATQKRYKHRVFLAFTVDFR
jgi:hypothetical protein